MTWELVDTCVSSDAESINSMLDASKEITYKTAKKILGNSLTELEDALGYDTGSARGGLRMSKDFAVSYGKSVYRGDPCVFVQWSRIEHIFVDTGRKVVWGVRPEKLVHR